MTYYQMFDDKKVVVYKLRKTQILSVCKGNLKEGRYELAFVYIPHDLWFLVAGIAICFKIKW